jgi:hypothetical protein
MIRSAPLLILLLLAGTAQARTKPKHYDHGTDESSFQLTAHIKETRQEASRCVSTVDIGNSEIEVYNSEHPSSCLGFSSLSAGMNFKARFALICKGHFDNCSTKSAADSRAGILVYLPPVVPGADAIIQEYVVVGTREIPDAP